MKDPSEDFVHKDASGGNEENDQNFSHGVDCCERAESLLHRWPFRYETAIMVVALGLEHGWYERYDEHRTQSYQQQVITLSTTRVLGYGTF